jgi:hypothetical protein
MIDRYYTSKLLYQLFFLELFGKRSRAKLSSVRAPIETERPMTLFMPPRTLPKAPSAVRCNSASKLLYQLFFLELFGKRSRAKLSTGTILNLVNPGRQSDQ